MSDPKTWDHPPIDGGDDQTGSDSSLPPIPTIPSFDPIVGYLLAYNVTSRMVEDGELFAGLQGDDLGAAIAEHTLKVIHHGQETGLIDPMPAGATLQELGAYMDDLMTAAMDWPTLRAASRLCVLFGADDLDDLAAMGVIERDPRPFVHTMPQPSMTAFLQARSRGWIRP